MKSDADTNEITGTKSRNPDKLAEGLTLGFGADEAGRRVAEGAQDGADGQAQVLVARIQRH